MFGVIDLVCIDLGGGVRVCVFEGRGVFIFIDSIERKRLVFGRFFF